MMVVSLWLEAPWRCLSVVLLGSSVLQQVVESFNYRWPALLPFDLADLNCHVAFEKATSRELRTIVADSPGGTISSGAEVPSLSYDAVLVTLATSSGEDYLAEDANSEAGFSVLYAAAREVVGKGLKNPDVIASGEDHVSTSFVRFQVEEGLFLTVHSLPRGAGRAHTTSGPRAAPRPHLPGAPPPLVTPELLPPHEVPKRRSTAFAQLYFLKEESRVVTRRAWGGHPPPRRL